MPDISRVSIVYSLRIAVVVRRQTDDASYDLGDAAVNDEIVRSSGGVFFSIGAAGSSLDVFSSPAAAADGDCGLNDHIVRQPADVVGI